MIKKKLKPVFILLLNTWTPFTEVGGPWVARQDCCSNLSLASFQLKYLSSHIVVPGQREGGGETSIRPALFNTPPARWERDTWTKLHINRHPPRELLSYTTPTTSHQLPQSLKRQKKVGWGCRGGETAAVHPVLSQKSSLLGCLDNPLRHGGLKLAIWSKTNKVLELNLEHRSQCVNSLHVPAVFIQLPPTTNTMTNCAQALVTA